jgi:glycosyltransferase involved in cell wall biosynthesis
MKVAILAPNFFVEVKEVHGRDRIIFGGGERYLFELCKLLQSEGHYITVFQALRPGRNGDVIDGFAQKESFGQVQKKWNGINFICLQDNDRCRYNVNPTMNMMFNENARHYDLAIYFGTYMAYPYAVSPSISVCHGIYWDYPYHAYNMYDDKNKKTYLDKNLYGFKECDVCVAVDSNVKKVIQAIEPGSEKRINIIYNFVDTKAFTPKKKNKDDGKIKVLCPRRLTVLRGSNEFIRASRQYPEYEYLSVGQASDVSVQKQLEAWGKTTPHVQFIYKDMDKMPEVYHEADISVIPTMACEGLSLSCLPAGTEIIMENGRVKNIEDIQVGDSVLTHTGKYQKVTQTMNRKADKLYKIKVGGGFGTTIKMTGEHPVLAFKPPKNKNGWACRPGCRNHPIRSKYWDTATPMWHKAEELERGDIVVFPAPKITTRETSTLDLAEFLIGDDWLFNEEKIWHRYSNSKHNAKAKNIAEKLGVSIHTVYHAIQPSQKPSFRHDVESTKVGRVIKYLSDEKIELVNKFPRRIKMDENFMRLLGYYIAEGYSKEGVVGFCFHSKEKEYHEDVVELMERYFDADANISFDGNKANIIFCGKVIEEVLAGMVGYGAKNKELPEAVMTSPDAHVVELLKGMWRGDGHIRSEHQAKGVASYVSASRNLIQQTHLLLTRFGIYGYIQKRHHDGGKRNTWALNVTGPAACKLIELLDFKIQYAKRKRLSHQQYFERDGYLCGVIASIEAMKFDGLVYNIEVENDNSYVANNVTVHNCLESMASGLPVITTPVGGLGDAVIHGYNAFVYDPQFEELGEYIDILAKDKSLREKFGTRNREIAVECFDIKIWHKKWKTVIDMFK